jgi:hypothetical protein
MLLAVAFAVLPIVAAEPLITPLPTPLPYGVFPAPATVLPVNAALLVDADRVLITHDDGRVEDLTVGEPRITVGSRGVGTVTPTLTEGETITLEPVCTRCGASDALSWVVGPVDETSPAFVRDVTMTAERYDGVVRVSLTQQLSEEEEVLLHVVGADVDSGVDQYLWQLAPSVWSTFAVSGVEREACFDVTAVDAAGNESETRRACVDIVAAPGPLQLFGCASTGTANTALFALTALLLRRRRR